MTAIIWAGVVVYVATLAAWLIRQTHLSRTEGDALQSQLAILKADVSVVADKATSARAQAQSAGEHATKLGVEMGDVKKRIEALQLGKAFGRAG